MQVPTHCDLNRNNSARNFLIALFAKCNSGCLACVLAFGCSSKTVPQPNEQIESKATPQAMESALPRFEAPSPSPTQEQDSSAQRTVKNIEATTKSTSLDAITILQPLDISALKERAATIVDAMASQFPNDPDAMEAKARFYRMIGKLDVAKACWDHAIEQAPEYGYAHQGLGSIAIRNSDYAGAVESFLKAVKTMPGDSTAVHELSDALMKNGDSSEAIKVLEAQIAMKPQSSDTLQLLGQALLANREYAAASEAFQKSLDLAPDNHLSQQGLGAALVRLGKREEAKKWLMQQKSARSTSNMDSSVAQAAERADIAARLTYAAHVYLKHEKPDLAIEVLRTAATNEPRDEESRRLLVKLYQQVNKPKQAIEIAKQLAEISPNNLGYRMTIGTISQRLKDWATAQECFEYVVMAMPSRPEGYAALVELSILSGKNMEKAIELAKTVTDLRGTASDFATYGQTLAMNGKISEAIDVMRVASLKDPESQNFKNILEQLIKSQGVR